MIMALIYRNVGRKRTNELLLLGEQISAAEAERIGLVNRVAPAARLDDATEQLAQELLQCAPLAVGLAKGVLNSAGRPGLAGTLEQEVAAQELCATSDDFREATQALGDKRAPQFSGR
jgi:enoyl-CoA hydratase/carnithine racemase